MYDARDHDPIRLRRRLARGVALAALALAACDRGARVDDDSGAAALMRNLANCRGVDVEIALGGASIAEVEDSIARCAARAEQTFHRDYRIATAPLPGVVKRRARIVVGTVDDARARSLAARTGLTFDRDEHGAWFQWRDDARFADPRDGIIATFEDPERAGLPITLVLANSAAALPGYYGDLDAGWRPALRLFSAGELALRAPLRRAGAVIAARIDRPLERRRTIEAGFQDLPRNDLGISGRASGAIAPDLAKSYLAFAGEARGRVAAWAEPRGRAPELSLILYASPDDYAAGAPTSALAWWNRPGNVVHALCVPSQSHDGGAAIARAAAFAWLGEPADPWLADGAATDAARSWWNTYLDRWVSWLHRGGLIPPLRTIVDPSATARISPHVLVPARAALFRFLIDSRGASFVRDLWRGAVHLSVDDDLERAFDAHWSALDQRFRDALVERRAERSPANAWSVFAKGIGIEAPDAEPDRGFGSRRCEQTLSEIRALGANAIAVSASCIAERDPARDVGIGAPASFGFVEGDVGVYATLVSAKLRKQKTLFLPQLLSAPAGSWNGAWVRTSSEGWQSFFESYERFIVHCALFSELAGVDVLCLGSDMPDVARGTSEGRRARPEEVEEKRVGWTRVIAVARSAFAGRLTYAASSITEARKIAFWHELDAVGMQLFYPERVQADVSTLAGSIAYDLDGIQKLAQEQDKPLLITQVGFVAAGADARAPRSGPGSVDSDVQAEAFRWLDTLIAAPSARGPLRGVFLWRWSTDPADRGANARDYLFARKAATSVVARLFERL